MKKSYSFISYSLITALAILACKYADAGIRVGNVSRNYAGSYKNTVAVQQYNNMMTQGQDIPVQVDLPVAVSDFELAERIRNGDNSLDTDINDLNECASIYPDGEFVWDRANLGRNRGTPGCSAIVELRTADPSDPSGDPSAYRVLARGKLAAGDTISCDIADFPQSTYLPEIMDKDVIFPADNPPTREDVIKVLNEEQKNRAGLKIGAAALIGAIGGNMVGKSAQGSDKIFGANKEKLATTAGGAAVGAALMATSTYSGKVAGDMILHGGMNAAAGGVVGNMAASGEGVLKVEKCEYEGRQTTCLWGRVQKMGKAPNGTVYYDLSDGSVVVCEDNGLSKCSKRFNIKITSLDTGTTPATTVDDLHTKDPADVLRKATIFKLASDSDKNNPDFDLEALSTQGDIGNGSFVKASGQEVSGSPINAVVVDFKDSTFGTKKKDWNKWKDAHKDAKICPRDNRGNPYSCKDSKEETNAQQGQGDETADKTDDLYTLSNFTPITVDASDGAVVDFSNKARLGSTLKGAGAGGAIGAFSGYQGAQSDIEARLNEATTEYNDSLYKFYCYTGRRFLGFYKDEVTIAPVKQSEN